MNSSMNMTGSFGPQVPLAKPRCGSLWDCGGMLDVRLDLPEPCVRRIKPHPEAPRSPCLPSERICRPLGCPQNTPRTRANTAHIGPCRPAWRPRYAAGPSAAAPGAGSVHVVEPPREYVPTSQATRGAVVEGHLKPTGHRLHDCCPPSEFSPGAHACGAMSTRGHA